MVRPTKEERAIHHAIWDGIIEGYDNFDGTNDEWKKYYILSQIKNDVLDRLYLDSTFNRNKIIEVEENSRCVLCEISERLYKKETYTNMCDFCHTLLGDWKLGEGCLGGLYMKAQFGDREAMVKIRNLI